MDYYETRKELLLSRHLLDATVYILLCFCLSLDVNETNERIKQRNDKKCKKLRSAYGKQQKKAVQQTRSMVRARTKSGIQKYGVAVPYTP